MPHLARRLAPAALLSALCLTACSQPQPQVAMTPAQQIPAQLLACLPQPVPPAIVTDADLATYLADLADAGADCRTTLAAVKQALGQ